MQANTLLKNDKMVKGDVSGEILNNTGTMEYQKTSRQLSVSFRLALDTVDTFLLIFSFCTVLKRVVLANYDSIGTCS